jgi:hypothetical protein
MAPRIDLLECLADVFVGGVLSTRLRGVSVIIQSDPVCGWKASLVVSPSQVIALNGELQQIVGDLHEQFDLAE